MIRSLTVSCPDPFRLLDIIHADQKLYLVFEFLDVDLKRYMENGNKNGRPITPAIVKVWSPFSLSQYLSRPSSTSKRCICTRV